MNAREYAIFQLARIGLSDYATEKVLRLLPAIQRSHEAACNWPDDIAGPVVKRGDAAFVACQAIFADYPGIGRVIEQGDPRGAPVHIIPAGKGETDARSLPAKGYTVAQIERIDRAYAAAGKPLAGPGRS